MFAALLKTLRIAMLLIVTVVTGPSGSVSMRRRDFREICSPTPNPAPAWNACSRNIFYSSIRDRILAAVRIFGHAEEYKDDRLRHFPACFPGPPQPAHCIRIRGYEPLPRYHTIFPSTAATSLLRVR